MGVTVEFIYCKAKICAVIHKSTNYYNVYQYHFFCTRNSNPGVMKAKGLPNSAASKDRTFNLGVQTTTFKPL